MYRPDYVLDEKANKNNFNRKNSNHGSPTTNSIKENFSQKNNDNNISQKSADNYFSQKSNNTNDNINNFNSSRKNSVMSIGSNNNNSNIITSKSTLKPKSTPTPGLRDRLGIDPLLLPALGGVIMRGILS